MVEVKTVLVTGYAKAPQGTAMHERYKHAGIVLEINPENHVIVNAEFTFITHLAKDFLQRLIVGYDLSNGIDNLITKIQSHYFAPSTISIIQALKSAYKRYEDKKI